MLFLHFDLISMRNLFVYFASIFFLIYFAACQPSGGISADESERVAVLANLPRMEYNHGGVAFSLAEIEGLKQVNKDSVPWASYMQESEDNGQMGYYFFPGFSRDLSSPQIRVEYMAKSLKGCSTEDSLFGWLKGLYLGPERKGVLASEAPVGTLDGDPVTILEITIPKYVVNDSSEYSPKWMAWAYAENGDRFVGFSYTTVSADDYKQGLPLFKDLVRSYKHNK